MRTRSMAARSRAPRSAAPPARVTGRDLRSKRASLKRKQLASVSEVPEIPKLKTLELLIPEKKASKMLIPERKTQRTLSEATDILKLKKEAFDARRLLSEVRVPGALQAFLKAKEEEDESNKTVEPQLKKRKMVFKTKLPETLITFMRLQPCRDLPEDILASKSEDFRRRHALRCFVDGKMRAYEEALIAQHDNKGYAEDESEITDDEE